MESPLSLALEELQLSAASAAFARAFVEREVSSGRQESIARALAWLGELAQARVGAARHPRSVLSPPSPWQRGCPEVVPGLAARPFWPLEALPPALISFVEALERARGDILCELLALRGQRAFSAYRAPSYDAAAGAASGVACDAPAREGRVQESGGGEGDCSRSSLPGDSDAQPLGKLGTDRGHWSVLYLDLHGAESAGVEANRARCPATVAALALAPRPYGHAMFSALAPGTHIPTHTGASNKKLRVHLPLVVPSVPAEPAADGKSSSCLRVGPQTRSWREGRCVVFDDSWQHEAWHDAGAGEARIVLICDVWHPDLTDAEVKLLSYLRSAQVRRAKALSEARAMPPSADFFAVLADARRRGADDEAVFGGPQEGCVPAPVPPQADSGSAPQSRASSLAGEPVPLEASEVTTIDD